MITKKTPGRFTVKFNVCDPLQRAAAELLEQQGRHKAQFLANAILHYQKAEDGDKLQVIRVADDDLEERIRAILDRVSGGNLPLQEGQPSEPKGKPTSDDRNNLDAFFSGTEIPAITETLAAFLPK